MLNEPSCGRRFSAMSIPETTLITLMTFSPSGGSSTQCSRRAPSTRKRTASTPEPRGSMKMSLAHCSSASCIIFLSSRTAASLASRPPELSAYIS